MDGKIVLRNFHAPWSYSTHDFIEYWWKGQIFYKNKLMTIEKIVESLHLNNKSYGQDTNHTIDSLRRLNGSFSIIIETAQYMLCVVDRIRSIPLFYSSVNNSLIISDDANYLRELLDATFNEEHGAEFLVTGYVTGPDTLFDGIFQLQAGEFLVFDKLSGNFSINSYFHYLHGNYSIESEEQHLTSLDEVMVSVFNRLIDTTTKKGKTIVVPLSGGLDSRLIVAMLKRLGVKDVICFSYGKTGNHEAKISKKVAEALEYPWYFVEYTSRRWYDCHHSDEMRAYERYASNFVSLPVIQDYLAVKILKEEGKIPDTAVFIPGHTGDMISGGHIPRTYDQSSDYTFEKFLADNLKKHYNLWRWDRNELESLFKEKTWKCVGDIFVNDNESCANAIELFDFNERQAKFIVNSVRVYEFFGYDWRIPLWDAELIDFFLKIPLLLRLDQKIYKKYCFKKVFNNEREPLSRIPCTTISGIPPSLPRMKILSHLWNTFFNPDIGTMCGFKNPNMERFKCCLRGKSICDEKNIEIQGIKDILCIQNNRFPSCNGILTLLYLENLFHHIKMAKSNYPKL